MGNGHRDTDDTVLPCGHAVIRTDGGDRGATCTRPAGHDAIDGTDHSDDGDRTWPAASCETDLHENLRPVLTLVYPNGARMTWCALCLGRIVRDLR